MTFFVHLKIYNLVNYEFSFILSFFLILCVLQLNYFLQKRKEILNKITALYEKKRREKRARKKEARKRSRKAENKAVEDFLLNWEA